MVRRAYTEEATPDEAFMEGLLERGHTPQEWAEFQRWKDAGKPRGDAPAVPEAGHTWSEVEMDFRVSLHGKSPATVQRYERELATLRSYLVAATGASDPLLTKITDDHLTAYLAARLARRPRRREKPEACEGALIKASTFKLAWTVTVRMARIAEIQYCKGRRSLIPTRPTNPLEGFDPKPPSLRKRDVNRLLGLASRARKFGGRTFALLFLLLATGIRIGEALRAEVGDCDFAGGHFIVRRLKKRTQEVVTDNLPMMGSFLLAMRHWVEVDRPAYLARKGVIQSRALFPCLCGDYPGAPMADWAARDLIYRLYGRLAHSKRKRLDVLQGAARSRVAAELDTVERMTVHALRRTFALLCLDGGAAIMAVSQQLGHSNVLTTMTYLKRWDDQYAAMMRRLNPLKDYRTRPLPALRRANAAARRQKAARPRRRRVKAGRM